MTTNLVESINLVLKKTQNLPMSTLVKSTYTRCNALFNQRGREATTMITFGQIYTQVLSKTMEDTQRKVNSHIVLEFGQFDT